MVDQGYAQSASDYYVYVKKFDSDDFIIMLIYVDDMVIVEWDKSKIEKLKKELSKPFEMKDLGPARQILGMMISRDRKMRHLWVSHECYIQKVPERFRTHQWLTSFCETFIFLFIFFLFINNICNGPRF